MASPGIRERLRAPFPAGEVRQRKGPGGKMLDFVGGEQFIRRITDVTADEEFGYAWTAAIAHVERTGNPDDGYVWHAVVHGQLSIQGDVGGGVGAMSNPDLDMACKSANTEAFKNAAKNGFAIGLELWDAEYREQLAVNRRALAGSEQAMKEAIWRIAQQRDPKAKTKEAVATLFGVKPGLLNDKATMQQILRDEGLLPDE